MCCTPYRTSEHEDECELCGAIPANHAVEGWDRCPTDRGTEERYYTILLCDRCKATSERRCDGC